MFSDQFIIKEEEDGRLTLNFPYIRLTIPPNVIVDLRDAGFGDHEELRQKAARAVSTFYDKDVKIAMAALHEFLELRTDLYGEEPVPCEADQNLPISALEKLANNFDSEEYSIDAIPQTIPIVGLSLSRIMIWSGAMTFGLWHTFTVGPMNTHIGVLAGLLILWLARDYLFIETPNIQIEEEN